MAIGSEAWDLFRFQLARLSPQELLASFHRDPLSWPVELDHTCILSLVFPLSGFDLEWTLAFRASLCFMGV